MVAENLFGLKPNHAPRLCGDTSQIAEEGADKRSVPLDLSPRRL